MSAKRPRAEPSWQLLGRPLRRQLGRKFFGAAKASPPGPSRVNVGDAVLVRLSVRDKKTKTRQAAGEVVALFEEEGAAMAEVRWLYTAPETRLGARKGHEAELFETDHVQDVELETLLARVVLLGPAELEAERARGGPEGLGETAFLVRQFWSAKRNAFLPVESTPRLRRQRSILYSRYAPDEPLAAPAARAEAEAPADLEAGAVDDYDRATARLNPTHVPERLPCRDEERGGIESFLRLALTTQGSGSSLYISGMPGTGKTAVVREVVRKLRREADGTPSPADEPRPPTAKKAKKAKTSAVHAPAPFKPFVFVEFNGMKSSQPHLVYSELWEAVSGQSVPPTAAAVELELYFDRVDPDKMTTVLMVDEMDYMVTTKQTVLYNLYDWPSRPQSKLVVMGIANTMDLPERLLPRVSSRLGSRRVIFRPYGREQVQEILTHRLNGLSLFGGGALEMTARKVASVSGDMRRALQISGRAVEICRAKGRPKVTIADIQRAARDLDSTPHLRAAATAAPTEVLLFVALACETLDSGQRECPFDRLRRRMGKLAASADPPAILPRPAELREMLRRLADSRVLRAHVPAGERDPLVCLNMEVTDVAQSLRDQPLAQKHLAQAY